MNKVQNNFNRFANRYNAAAIIQAEISKRLFSRFDIINPTAKTILELGAGTGLLTQELLKKYPANNVLVTDFAKNTLKINPATNKLCLDAHALPFKNNLFDVVISNLMMQWCDLDKVINATQTVLKDNGLFIFSTFGPQTLIELKQSWQTVDNNHHTRDFIDMHNIGDKLLAMGFTGVVIESEIITLTYETVMDLLSDIKNIGAQNSNPKPSSKSKLQQMIQHYQTFKLSNNKIPASYEVIYAHCWVKPKQQNIQLINA